MYFKNLCIIIIYLSLSIYIDYYCKTVRIVMFLPDFNYLVHFKILTNSFHITFFVRAVRYSPAPPPHFRKECKAQNLNKKEDKIINPKFLIRTWLITIKYSKNYNTWKFHYYSPSEEIGAGHFFWIYGLIVGIWFCGDYDK